MVLSATPRDYLRTIAVRLDAAGHGKRTAIVAEAAAHLGISQHSVYTRLARDLGWSSERSTRADKGRSRVADDVLQTVGAMQRLGRRENGKQILFVPTAASIAASSGIDIPVSNSHLSRLMRARKLDPKSQAAEKPVQHLNAPHPNHTHEIDPSLCLLYYSKGQQHVIRDDQLYKNKLGGLAKVKFKVWRYVCYDRASGCVKFRYFEAAGEGQENLFEFLMWAWGKAPGITLHGVPFNVLWDKGSANTSAGVQRVADALEIKTSTHAPGAARVSGGVEGGQNIVETMFESRLRYEPVQNIDELNAAAVSWQEAYNANRLPAQDTRIHREGIDPIARYDLWNRIRAEELRELPDVEILRAYLEGRQESRKVRPDLSISYRHPRGDRPDAYDLAGLDGICRGDVVEVRPLVFGNRAITVRVARYDGAPLVYRVEPTRQYDAYGNILGAPVLGEEFRQPRHTAIERAAKRMDALAFPDCETAEDIRKARARGATPFGGELKAISSLHEIEQTTWLPRRGTPIDVRAPIVEEAPLSVTEAAVALRARGVAMPDLFGWLSQHYPNGVAPGEMDSIVERLQRLEGDGGLKVISG